MGKAKELKKLQEELEQMRRAEAAGKADVEADTPKKVDAETEPEPSQPEPKPEPKPSKPDQKADQKSEPKPSKSEPKPSKSDKDLDKDPEKMTAEELEQLANQMSTELEGCKARMAAKISAGEDRIAAIKAKAEAKAKEEAEAKAKAEAEAKAKAEAEAKARAEAGAVVAGGEHGGPKPVEEPNGGQSYIGAAYKWKDLETGTWHVSENFWAVKQVSSEWEKVYAWYADGQLQRVLSKAEVVKYHLV